MKGYSACLTIGHLNYFSTFQIELFCLMKLFFAPHGHFFLPLELLCNFTYASKIDQAVVDLKLGVKLELVLTHYDWHGRGTKS